MKQKYLYILIFCMPLHPAANSSTEQYLKHQKPASPQRMALQEIAVIGSSLSSSESKSSSSDSDDEHTSNPPYTLKKRTSPNNKNKKGLVPASSPIQSSTIPKLSFSTLRRNTSPNHVHDSECERELSMSLQHILTTNRIKHSPETVQEVVREFHKDVSLEELAESLTNTHATLQDSNSLKKSDNTSSKSSSSSHSSHITPTTTHSTESIHNDIHTQLLIRYMAKEQDRIEQEQRQHEKELRKAKRREAISYVSGIIFFAAGAGISIWGGV